MTDSVVAQYGRNRRIVVRDVNGDPHGGKVVHRYDGDVYLLKLDRGTELRRHVDDFELEPKQ